MGELCLTYIRAHAHATCCQIGSPSAAQEYVCLAFSVDGSFLAAQGAGPEWNLAMWQWEKSKLSGIVRGATQARHQCAPRPMMHACTLSTMPLRLAHHPKQRN